MQSTCIFTTCCGCAQVFWVITLTRDQVFPLQQVPDGVQAIPGQRLDDQTTASLRRRQEHCKVPLYRSGMRRMQMGGQTILTLRSLVKPGRWEYLWSDYMASRSLPPLVLRLIRVTNNDKTIYLVSNTKEDDLSEHQAGEIYTRVSLEGVPVARRIRGQCVEGGENENYQ